MRDLEAAGRSFEALGLVVSRVMEVPNRPLRVAFLPVGNSEVELLEPTEAGSDIARFLREQGEGVHHLCFEVDDIDAALEEARAAGLRLIDQTPRKGASGRIAFLHPESAHGVRIELVEKV